MTQPKKWTKEALLEMLEKSDKAVAKALLVLYGFQTAEEQAVGATREDNGAGFNGADADYLSSVAQFAEKTGFLTAKQLTIVRPKIRKYWKQLLNVANANEQAKSVAHE